MYYDKIVGSSLSNFTDIVTIGEHIENGLKMRKIANIDNQTVAKKFQSFAKKKEAEASVVIENVYPQVQAQYQQPTYQAQSQQPLQAQAPPSH